MRRTPEERAAEKAEVEAKVEAIKKIIGARAIEAFIDDLLRDPNHPGWKRLAERNRAGWEKARANPDLYTTDGRFWGDVKIGELDDIRQAGISGSEKTK